MIVFEKYGFLDDGYQPIDFLIILYKLTVSFTIVLLNYYIIYSLQLKSFNQFNIITERSITANKFLDRLLPKHIQDFFNRPNARVGERYHNVSILFADIAGFTAFSSGRRPREVVEMLSKLYTEFDKICQKMNLYK